MILGVLSDTHSHVEYTQDAVRIMRSLGVETVLHCGDIGSVSIIPVFEGLPAHFVLGNVDWNEREMRAAIAAAGQTYHGRFGKLVVEDRRIALLHGDDEQRLREAIERDEVDVVCYGHTHVAEHHFENGKLVVNPGAVWRSRPPSVAVLDLAKMRAMTVPI
jgi:putative phosphoesterase